MIRALCLLAFALVTSAVRAETPVEEIASLLLSRMTVPITYYLSHRPAPAAAPASVHEGVRA